MSGGTRDAVKRGLSRARPAELVAFPALAVVAMAVWILWGADEQGSASAKFISTPQFLLWLLILCGQAAVWALVFVFVGITLQKRIRDLRDNNQLPRARIVGFVVALLILLAPAVVGALFATKTTALPFSSVEFRDLPDVPLEGHSWKVFGIVCFALGIGFGAIVGMWATALLLTGLRPGDRPTKECLEQFLALRRDLVSLLAVAGALVGLATLGAGALRLAVLATGKQLAAEYVLAYGLFFTGVLAIAFAPAFVAMRGAGARLRDAAHPLVAPNDPDFADVIAKRAALDAVLETNLSASAMFKAGVAILTPLAGSLLALVLPGA